MQALNSSDASAYQRRGLIAQRSGTGLPPGLKLVRLLGKGANNSVYLYRTRADELVVVRQPRKGSDTRRLGNATWEFRNTAIATSVGAAPLLFDAWYNRTRTSKQRAGLHIICGFYSKDVHTLLVKDAHLVLSIQKELSKQTISHIRAMANTCLFCYDLKPSNMVFNNAPIDVRFIDFGRDFCEWRPYCSTNEPVERAPVLSYIQTIADENATPRFPGKELYIDLMYTIMLILLSANIEQVLEENSHDIRCSYGQRAKLNFIALEVTHLRRSTCQTHVKLVQKILRHPDIRETLKHYLGRKNGGTKRTFMKSEFIR